MEKPQRLKKEPVVDNEKLHHKYTNLKQEWDSINQPKRRTLIMNNTKCATDPTTAKVLKWLDSSPRNLMTSLQGGETWKVRNNDFAVEELVRERRVAIESGKLKGRKLFDGEDEENEVGYGGICDGSNRSGFNEGLEQKGRRVFDEEEEIEFGFEGMCNDMICSGFNERRVAIGSGNRKGRPGFEDEEEDEVGFGGMRERRVAIESGNRRSGRGRRFFEEETEVGMGGMSEEIICRGLNDLDQEESDVKSVLFDDENEPKSSTFSPKGCSLQPASLSSSSDEKSGEEFIEDIEEKRIPSGLGGDRGRWIAVVLVCAIGFLILMMNPHGYRDLDGEMFLVPT